MPRLTSVLGPVALATVLAACSGVPAASGTPGPSTSSTGPSASGTPGTSTGSTGSTGPTGSSGDSVSITAKNIAFVQKAVTVKAGTAFAIVFENKDGAPHNIAIFDSAGGNVFKGSQVAGGAVTYSVPALAAGAYGFVCQVHPEMQGVITAK